MVATRPVQPTERELTQRFEALQRQLRSQTEARCVQERALLERIKLLERELTESKARESSLQQAINSQQKLMQALEKQRKNPASSGVANP
jgi:hypothetical protein